MSKITVYAKIETVLKARAVPMAPHEFNLFWFRQDESAHPQAQILARAFVGQSESAIGRRLREMRELGRVTSQRREGTAFVEYALVVRVPAQEPLCPI